MIPGGVCFVENHGPGLGFHVIHERSNRTQAIIYPFVSNYKAADQLARDCNLEICKRLHSTTANELRKLARRMMAQDEETFSEG